MEPADVSGGDGESPGSEASVGRGLPPASHGVSLSLEGRVAVLQELAERLAGAADVTELARSVGAGLRQGLGATAVSLGMVSPDGQSLVTLVAEGFSAAANALMSTPLRFDGSPASAALAKGEPVLWSTLAERDRDFPEYSGYPSAMQSWAILPLMIQGTAIGVVSLGWEDPHEFTPVESAFLKVLAHQCAVAVDRARIDQMRRAERETLELLSEGTRLMVSALDPGKVIESLVALAVPRLAPWCAVYVAEGPVLRRVAIQIAGEDALATELRGRPADSVDDATPLAVAFRTGELHVVPVEESVVRSIYSESHAQHILGQPGTWSGLCVPIRVAGEVIGVMSLVSNEWAPSPPDGVRFAAEGLAARAGVALANARQFEIERHRARMLMDAFLPASLPEIPGYDAFARYLPAGSKVAGDWFDLLRLPTGRFLFGIGDAGGHGLEAVSLMCQLRNAARGMAMAGHGPASILEGLQLLTEAEGADRFATAAYATLDPHVHAVRWAAAGHLPPLQFGEGAARYLDHVRNPPLGWRSPAATEHVVRWEAGDGIALVTDGVVERRDRGLEEGMEELRALVVDHGNLGAKDLTDVITEIMCTRAEDDCCVVVLKRR